MPPDQFYCQYNKPDDKKEYAKRLLGYKINQLEWKNLMVRINEAEAGLNSFFNDCKTNSALIKKWFITRAHAARGEPEYSSSSACAMNAS